MKRSMGYEMTGWRKGTRIRRRWGQGYISDGTVVSDGEYKTTSTSGLWYFNVHWGDGTSSRTVPLVNDEVLS